MSERKTQFQSYEAVINHINALESNILYTNHQLSKLKP